MRRGNGIAKETTPRKEEKAGIRIQETENRDRDEE